MKKKKNNYHHGGSAGETGPSLVRVAVNPRIHIPYLSGSRNDVAVDLNNIRINYRTWMWMRGFVRFFG